MNCINSEGLAIATFNKKWGFVDVTGKTVIDFKYDYAYEFSKGVAKVQLDGETFYIDKKGNQVD